MASSSTVQITQTTFGRNHETSSAINKHSYSNKVTHPHSNAVVRIRIRMQWYAFVNKPDVNSDSLAMNCMNTSSANYWSVAQPMGVNV